MMAPKQALSKKMPALDSETQELQPHHWPSFVSQKFWGWRKNARRACKVKPEWDLDPLHFMLRILACIKHWGYPDQDFTEPTKHGRPLNILWMSMDILFMLAHKGSPSYSANKQQC